jgi:alpha-galactosidase
MATLLATGERKRVSSPTTKEKAEEWAEKLRFYVKVAQPQYRFYRNISVKRYYDDDLYVVIGVQRNGKMERLSYAQLKKYAKGDALMRRNRLKNIPPHLREYKRIYIEAWVQKD